MVTYTRPEVRITIWWDHEGALYKGNIYETTSWSVADGYLLIGAAYAIDLRAVSKFTVMDIDECVEVSLRELILVGKTTRDMHRRLTRLGELMEYPTEFADDAFEMHKLLKEGGYIKDPALWSGSECQWGNCWIDDKTGEHVNATTNERTPSHPITNLTLRQSDR
jgi:hypothetical protein